MLHGFRIRTCLQSIHYTRICRALCVRRNGKPFCRRLENRMWTDGMCCIYSYRNSSSVSVLSADGLFTRPLTILIWNLHSGIEAPDITNSFHGRLVCVHFNEIGYINNDALMPILDRCWWLQCSWKGFVWMSMWTESCEFWIRAEENITKQKVQLRNHFLSEYLLECNLHQQKNGLRLCFPNAVVKIIPVIGFLWTE